MSSSQRALRAMARARAEEAHAHLEGAGAERLQQGGESLPELVDVVLSGRAPHREERDALRARVAELEERLRPRQVTAFVQPLRTSDTVHTSADP